MRVCSGRVRYGTYSSWAGSQFVATLTKHMGNHERAKVEVSDKDPSVPDTKIEGEIPEIWQSDAVQAHVINSGQCEEVNEPLSGDSDWLQDEKKRISQPK